MHRVASAVCAGSGLHAYFHFSSQSSSTAYCEARAAETPRKGENAALRFIRAHIIFRHGARTPVFPVGPTNAAYPIRWEMCSKVNQPPGTLVELYPDLPAAELARLSITDLDGKSPQPVSQVDTRQFRTSLPGGCRNGQLTPIGVVQANELGRKLRRRYGRLVDLDTVRIHARTSNVARCITTLAGVLGSLLPKERLHHEGSIPVRTTDVMREYLYPNKSSCPIVEYYLLRGKKAWLENPGEEARKLNAELKRWLSPDEANDFLVDQMHFVRINDWLTTSESNGIRNPWGFDTKFRERIRKQAAAQVASYLGFQQKEQAQSSRVAIGRFVEEIEHAVQEDDDHHSLTITSGHDTTVIPLLMVLGLFEPDWPSYCACICIETWADAKGNKVVKVLFEGEEKLQLSLEEFRRLIKPAIAEIPWQEECRLSEQQFLITGASTGSHY